MVMQISNSTNKGDMDFFLKMDVGSLRRRDMGGACV